MNNESASTKNEWKRIKLIVLQYKILYICIQNTKLANEASLTEKYWIIEAFRRENECMNEDSRI